VPPIKDQNACAACFAFAPSTALEWSLLARQDASGFVRDHSPVVSPQSILSCAGAGAGADPMDECLDGGFADVAVSWLASVGAQTEPEYPFADANICCSNGPGPATPQAGGQTGVVSQSGCIAPQNGSSACQDVAACKANYAADQKATGWGYLGTAGALPTVVQMKTWISNFGALVVAVKDDGWGAYGGGVFSNNVPYSAGMDHIVVVIGWDDAAPTTSGGTAGAWIIQNSWGTGWGDPCGFGSTKGYMYLQYGSSNVGFYALWVSA
jgi:C1A family cysteine protease